MRKLLLPIIAGFILAAIYMISGAKNPLPAAYPYYGDADALGSDDDANARYNYELNMLKDPATGRIPNHIRERELAFAATLPGDRDIPFARTTAGLSWDARGPWNVGGRTRAMAIDVSNENNLIAGSCSGGMWRSTDRGRTWQQTIPNSQFKSVSGVAQDMRPGHTNVWYYTTGEAYGSSASDNGAYFQGNGVYKSTDSGKTWTVLTSTKAPSATIFNHWSDVTWGVATNNADTAHDAVYVAAYGGVYKTTDGGTTWNICVGTFGSSSDSYFTDVAVSNTGIVYVSISSAGAAKGLYRSADGVTFTNITPAGFPTTYNRVKIGISPSDPNQVYFLGNTPGFGMPDTNFLGQVEWNSLWKYNYDTGNGSGAGGRWRDLSMNLPSAGGVFDKFTCQGSYDLVVKVKPNDTNVVFIGGTNLYRSNSGFRDNTHTQYIGGYQQGASLPVVNMYINHHPDQHELVFFGSDPNKMISANDGGIFYCNDNTVPQVLWTSLNNGYLTSMFYTCAIDHASTNDIIIGGAQDNGSWFTNSASLTHPWVTPRGGDGSYCAIADRGAAYYFSIQNGKIMKAKVDNSGRLDSFARIDPKGGKGYQFINPFVIDPNDNNIMYVAGRALWRNSNLGGIPYAGNWDSISTNWVKFPDLSGDSISCIAVSKNPANRVYYGTVLRKICRIDSANVGTPTVKNLTSTLFPGSGNVSCIAVDPNDANKLLLAFSNYGLYSIFYSADGGATWKKAAGNLEVNKITGAGDGPSIRWVSILPVAGGNVYLAGTSIGLFATTYLNDTGTKWVQQGANTIGNSVVDMIDYRSTDGLVVVATHANAIYSTHITSAGDITGVKDIVAVEQDFGFKNYPNPFTSETTIQFELPVQCNVSVNIFDQAGRLVRTVANEQMNKGEYKYLFATNGLPAGIYYCNLVAGAHSETKRLVVAK